MREAGEGAKKDRTPAREAFMAAAGMCLFALFIHGGFPYTLFSACGLLVTTLAVSRGVRADPSPAALFGVRHFSPAIALYTFCGIIPGVALGLFYQWSYGLEIHFPALGRFAPVTAFIGASEEVLYRGYVQGRAREMGPFLSAVFASLAHAAYKLCLFILPSGAARIDFLPLAACTFAVGLGMGLMRQYTKSILPPIAAHVCFDLIVYGGFPRAPWWVWG
ncbi:MAG: CPBP family intramembrane metalloprotease [Desulfobacterales bacterium]|nr:CPBP family intramembrane metalloprotease [Desulfobacterales bacterium]